MIIVNLGKGNVGIRPIANSKTDEVGLEFLQLDHTGVVGERIGSYIGQSLCKVVFENIEGLENLIKILNMLKLRAYAREGF